MFRGRRAPENSFYDGVNVLLNDEGEPFKRGGSALLSASDHGSTLLSVFDTILTPGQRTVAVSASNLYAMNGTTPVNVGSLGGFGGVVRAVEVGGFLVIPSTGNATHFYAGSLRSAAYTAGTVTTTAGSAVVTGAGTAWLANVDPGMVLQLTASGELGIVKTVNGDTQITLRDPPATAGAGLAYSLSPVLIPGALPGPPSSVAAVGTPARLVVTVGNRAYFSAPGAPATFDTATDYHELSSGAEIIGSAGTGNTLLLFTTAGVWAVSNMELDPLDDYGNVQQAVSRVGAIILWGFPGLASYDEAMVVPGIEDVYLFAPGGGSQPISEGIRPLYRSYVRAGYQPGVAVVHRGHYFLPVLNGTALVDVLVCRLDRGFAWTRWSGHAAGLAYAERIGSSTRSPKLYGISGQRITDLTDCFAPSDSNRMDAIGPAPAFSLTTRDFDTGPGIRGGLLRHARLEYDLVAPSALATIAVSAAAGAEGSAFTAHSDTAPEADGGSKTWMLNRYGERIRLRFDNSDATANMRLRRLELHMQDSLRP